MFCVAGVDDRKKGRQRTPPQVESHARLQKKVAEFGRHPHYRKILKLLAGGHSHSRSINRCSLSAFRCSWMRGQPILVSSRKECSPPHSTISSRTCISSALYRWMFLFGFETFIRLRSARLARHSPMSLYALSERKLDRQERSRPS